MRRDAVATIIEDADVPASRLEEWKAAEDERIDAEHAREVRILDVVHDVAKGAPQDEFMREVWATILAEVSRPARSDEQAVAAIKRTRHREQGDPDARWGSEIEALRAWCGSVYASRAGDTGRALERARTGMSGGIGSSTPIEPSIDDWLEAVRIVLKQIPPKLLAMLVMAEVELRAPRQKRNREGKVRDGGETVYIDGRDPREPYGGRADELDVVGIARSGLGLGFGGEASASARQIAKSGADDPGAQSWAQLVADQLGIVHENAIAEVEDGVKRARRILRDGLREVELGGEWRGMDRHGGECLLTPTEGMAIESGRAGTVKRGAGEIAISRVWQTKTKAAIPRPPAKDLRRERAREAPGRMAEACFGAPVISGVRLPCEVADRPEEDVAAAPICESCGRPRMS